MIDHDAEDVPKRVLEATGGAGADVVIDNVGAATWSRSLRSVRRGGRVVTCGATTGAAIPRPNCSDCSSVRSRSMAPPWAV